LLESGGGWNIEIILPLSSYVFSLSAPPPSYDSLFGRVREAHRASKGMIDFLKNVIYLLLGTSTFISHVNVT
jgi:hypothetical protein